MATTQFREAAAPDKFDHPMTSPDLDALRAFEDDPALPSLDAHVPTLSLARALGIPRKELPHSRVIATLFDPRSSRVAAFAWQRLLALCGFADAAGLEPAKWRLQSLRELDRVDVVLRGRAPGHDIVIGIENKIDAGEQPQQLARYQASLATRFPESTLLVVFLSPTGRAPRTANPASKVRVLALGYAALVELLLATVPLLGERDRQVVSEFAAHLKEEIVGDDTLREQVRAIYAKHPAAVRLLWQYRPQLRDFVDEYLERLTAETGEKCEHWLHPSRGDIREIKVRPKSWSKAGLLFVVMLHADPEVHDGRPAVRLWLAGHDFDAAPSRYRSWAANIAASGGLGGREVDPDFPPVTAWDYWRRVMREEAHPESAIVGTAALDRQTLDTAVERAAELVRLASATIPDSQ